MNDNFASLLEAVADELADAVAIIHGARQVTWAELDERAARLASHLASSGVGHESRVAISLYNSAEYVESLLAVLKLRAIPVNVNYRYRAEELTHILDDSGATAMILDEALSTRVAEACSGRELPTAFVQLGGIPPEVAGWISYEEAIRRSEPHARIERGDDEWWLYTGGTTGRPRAVVTRHSWLTRICASAGCAVIGEPVPSSLAELQALVRPAPGKTRHVCLPAAPLMHGAGIYNTMSTLLIGGVVVYAESRSFDGEEVAHLVEQHGVRQMAIVGDVFAVPFADALDRAVAAGRPYDVSSLRLVSSVGVTWSAEAKQRVLRHGHGQLTCQEIVSATEGGPFAISRVSSVEEAETARFTVAPGVRLLDSDDRDVPPGSGEVGILAAPTDEHIRYLGDPVRSAETFRHIDGRRYCILGDHATLESDGTLAFRGRGSQLINSGGEKIFAEEVEQVIARHPDVRDVMVVGAADPRWGQRVVALVALAGEAALTEADVREFVGGQLADYKRPRQVHFLAELRRNPAGKSDLAWAKEFAELHAGGAA